MADEPDDDTAAIFARIPRAQAEKLDRLAHELKRPKREILAGLVASYEPVGPHPAGSVGLRPASFEVLTVEQAAALLQTTTDLVTALAETGDLPGRKLGDEWRFSRRAVIAWLEEGAR